MFSFAWWWMIVVLPLPLLVRWFWPAAATRQQAALTVPFYDAMQSVLATTKGLHTAGWSLFLASMMWLALVSAAMRPQWLGEPLDVPLTGRDIMLGLDISGSMREQDFSVNGRTVERLEAAKVVASEFIAKREGDRVGLILFGDNAQVQTPLSYDLQTVQHFLNETIVGLIGSSTAIGDAIGLAVKRLRSRPAESRVFILLTDGANTAGAVSPLEAAGVAAQNDIRIHTIGVGTEAVTVEGLFGKRVINPSRSLDEETLQAIAETTGGQYFRARNTAEMVEIYDLINTLEPSEIDGASLRPLTELYIWPLALALLCSAMIVWQRGRN